MLQNHRFQPPWLSSVIILLIIGGGCQNFRPHTPGDCPAGYIRNEQRACQATNRNPTTPDALDDLGEADGKDSDSDPVCIPFEGTLMITEVHTNLEGSDGAGEYVEIVADGWTNRPFWLEGFSDEATSPYWSVPISGFTSMVEETSDSIRFRVGDSNSSELTLGCSSAHGCLQNGPDSLRVVDCADQILDTVSYPSLSSGDAWSRCELEESQDVDEMGSATPSPGEVATSFIKPDFCTASCTVATQTSIQLEQLYINPDGPDGTREFVVLRAHGSPTTPAQTLVGYNVDDQSHWLEQAIPADPFDSEGRLVIGGSSVEDSDIPLAGSLQNGPDGVSLFACDESMDHVQWGLNTWDAPDELPAPFSGELWVYCPDKGWQSLFFAKDAQPLSFEQLRSECDGLTR